MRTEYEYIVVGLGGLGSGALYWLARRAGANVLGLDQFELGHARGGSHDHTRIIRYSYHNTNYVTLAKRAYTKWAELEADCGEQLVFKVGGLDFAPRDSAIPLDDYMNSLRACDVPFEHLDATELMRRWPQLTLSDDIHGLYQADGGFVAAERATAAHQSMARAHGATLRDNAPISALRDLGDNIEVVAGGETYRCRTLIITAGAWTNDLLGHFGQHLPLTVTQEQVTYFASSQLEAFAPDRFPVWIWMDDPCFYGFPVYGAAGVKVAQDVGGRETTAHTRSFTPDPENTARVTRFVERCMPSAGGPLLLEKTCLYTLTPDRDFIIDRVRDHPNVLVATDGAHGFKFATLFGTILSELAIDGATSSDISPFTIDRPTLLMDNPPKQFMV